MAGIGPFALGYLQPWQAFKVLVLRNIVLADPLGVAISAS